MYSKLEEDRSRLPQLLEAVATYASGVCGGFDSGPVAVSPRGLSHSELSARGVGAEAVLELFSTSVAPSLTASAGPRHLGFVTGGGNACGRHWRLAGQPVRPKSGLAA